MGPGRSIPNGKVVIDRRAFLGAGAVAAAGPDLFLQSATAAPDRTLHNGIRLPDPWPPR